VRGLTAHLTGQVYGSGSWEGNTISNESNIFDDCMILSKDAFDPDAVFLEDIVDDDVLPYLSLEVDGLTTSRENKNHGLELRPEDVAANDAFAPDTTMPVAALDPNELDVYGWESSFWKKIKGYLGF
jgi:hypothetical protein